MIADDNDLIDYESLCKYIIRMGRSYTNMIQERLRNEDKMYKQIVPQLKRDFLVMLPVAVPR